MSKNLIKFILLFLVLSQNNYIKAEEEKVITKDWNFLVYIEANNDLNRFVEHNINQMMTVGSNSNINILVQVDTLGKKEISRILVNNNRIQVIQVLSNSSECVMGTPESLYKFVEWGTKNYPAKNLALVIWDHGNGIEDPSIWGKLWLENPEKIYLLNKSTGLLEINQQLLNDKGIAFNDTFETYLTNQDLKNTCDQISKKLLNGKKISILGMDACNMNMIEVGSQIKESVDIMVGSEETEPAYGWNYSSLLEPFKTKTLTSTDFAKIIVKSYEKYYQNSATNYTQSAIKLNNHNLLEKNTNEIALILLSIIESKDKNILINNLKAIRNNPKFSTIFANKNYIDLYNFYKNLLIKISSIKNLAKDVNLFTKLQDFLKQGLVLLESQIIENVTCNSLPNAKGLSIYFPTKQIHVSYYKTIFAKNTAWIKFLESYIKETKQTKES